MKQENFYLIVAVSTVAYLMLMVFLTAIVARKNLNAPRFRRRRRYDIEEQIRDIMIQSQESRQLIDELHQRVFSPNQKYKTDQEVIREANIQLVHKKLAAMFSEMRERENDVVTLVDPIKMKATLSHWRLEIGEISDII